MEIKARILVVDDNYDLCESIKDVLGENDYHVEYAANGKDAIELTRNNKYDIALIDIKLPDISGNEVVEKIAEISLSTEFIFMTGHATINSAIEAVKQERVVSYETKPLNPNHLLALINQITGRKQAENNLHESEAQFRGLFEQAAVGIVHVASNGQFLKVNKRFCEITGYAEQEILKRSYQDITYPDDLYAQKEARKKVLDGETSSYSIEKRYIRKDGTIIWGNLTAGVLIRKPSGEPDYFVSVLEDITERKKAEKRLKAQYLVTQVLAESATIKEASPKILEAICTALEWDFGEIWIVDQQENVLRNAGIWHIPSLNVPEFKAVTKQLTFSLQIGLPGRIWKYAKPIWVEDVVRDTTFLRASVAAKEGLHGAFGFPILSGSEVLGTINFFSHELRQPDENLLEMMSSVGIRIGLFIKRKQAEELLYVQKKDLEQKNIALHEILGQIEIEKKQIKDNVIANAENLLMPVIEKLRIKGESHKYVKLLQKNIHELTSSFGTKLTEKRAKLTSREIEICDMIKNGLTSKEIAGLLNINLRTIEKHRANIRNKLGIIKKDINLTSFLKTL